ncbi:MAG TPA: HAMP domain-containing sensor histidine kinase [Rhizomicrobium sp.]|nr:HAMP domain-containing sensor histidine kinase [Rhizomicrobium sp.]
MAIRWKIPNWAARRLRLESLSSRLIAAAAVWTMLGLVVGGAVLSNAFRMAAQNSFDAALQADMDGLIAAAEPDPNGGVMLAGRFLNHKFDRVYSGLYYQIKAGNSGGQISRSLFDRDLKPFHQTRKGPLTWGDAVGPENQRLRVVSRRVDLTPDNGGDADYTFLVAGDLSEVDRQTQDFNTTLFWSFLLLGLGLIAAILVQVKVGLLPLRQVSKSLTKIRDGEARRLDGKFPTEIAPLATELNSLIQHSEEVVGRARTHVSNLAHFLKTPLSVLAAEAEAHERDAATAPLAEMVKRQVFSMRRQVDHYLSRARAAGSLDVLGNRTQLSAVMDDLSRVIARIHAVRGVVIDAECDDGIYFRGERQDLEEMLGNLIDNGCKWAKSRVRARCEKTGGRLILTVEDDGPGLSAEQRSLVGERGERLDESVPGSGLGLAIVRDISKLYGGFFSLGESSLGGVQARLELPAIQ